MQGNQSLVIKSSRLYPTIYSSQYFIDKILQYIIQQLLNLEFKIGGIMEQSQHIFCNFGKLNWMWTWSILLVSPVGTPTTQTAEMANKLKAADPTIVPRINSLCCYQNSMENKLHMIVVICSCL